MGCGFRCENPVSGVIQNTSTLIPAIKILKLEQKLTETFVLNDILFAIC